VFAQRKNVANPKFLRMLADVVRFSRDADRLLADPSVDDLTLGELLKREGYSDSFSDWYLIPMGDAIWSTPPGEMFNYPAGTFLRFCDNHGLLHITGKPRWKSVLGGARTYIERATRSFSGEVYTNEPVEEILRTESGVRLSTPARTQHYDAVVLASHPPQSLQMLAEPTKEEREVLGAFSFWDNEVVLHTDESFMPKSRRAWAAWNFFSEGDSMAKDMLVLTYLINRLQDVPIETPVMETLNRDRPPAEGTLLDTLVFEHPSFTREAIRAQGRIGEIQGVGGVWFAGAWTRYGFHEDGILSGVKVAEALGAKLPWGHELDSSRTAVFRQFAEPEEHIAEDPADAAGR